MERLETGSDSKGFLEYMRVVKIWDLKDLPSMRFGESHKDGEEGEFQDGGNFWLTYSSRNAAGSSMRAASPHIDWSLVTRTQESIDKETWVLGVSQRVGDAFPCSST